MLIGIKEQEKDDISQTTVLLDKRGKEIRNIMPNYKDYFIQTIQNRDAFDFKRGYPGVDNTRAIKYESAIVFGKPYFLKDFPENDVFMNDIETMLLLYDEYVKIIYG